MRRLSACKLYVMFRYIDAAAGAAPYYSLHMYTYMYIYIYIYGCMHGYYAYMNKPEQRGLLLIANYPAQQLHAIIWHARIDAAARLAPSPAPLPLSPCLSLCLSLSLSWSLLIFLSLNQRLSSFVAEIIKYCARLRRVFYYDQAGLCLYTC